MNMIRVGRIVKPHGVKGELIVESYSDFPEQRFASGQQLELEESKELPDVLTVEQSRPHQGRLIVQFEEIGDRNIAEEFRDLWLVVPEESVEELESDEYYGFQFEGLTVLNQDAKRMGTIRTIDYPLKNPVFEIVTESDEVIEMPVNRELILDIDEEEETIQIYFPEGWQKLKQSASSEHT